MHVSTLYLRFKVHRRYLPLGRERASQQGSGQLEPRAALTALRFFSRITVSYQHLLRGALLGRQQPLEARYRYFGRRIDVGHSLAPKAINRIDTHGSARRNITGDDRRNQPLSQGPNRRPGVLIYVDTDLLAKDLLNSRMAYVAVSRGAHDAQIFTNNATAIGLRTQPRRVAAASLVFRSQQ
jgi:hypothetical protein